jgi:hypothetical protein
MPTGWEEAIPSPVYSPKVTVISGNGTQFGPVWESLTPREQARLVQRLIEKVEHDGQAGTVAITFHAAGIKTLADEILAQQQETLSWEKRA